MTAIIPNKNICPFLLLINFNIQLLNLLLPQVTITGNAKVIIPKLPPKNLLIKQSNKDFNLELQDSAAIAIIVYYH